MARILHLYPRLAAPELSQRARHAPNLVEARRWQLLVLVAAGKTVKEAALLVGLYPNYARRIVRRYNAEGAAGRRDRRLSQTAPVRPSLLNLEQQQERAAALRRSAPGGDGGRGQRWRSGSRRRPGGTMSPPNAGMITSSVCG